MSKNLYQNVLNKLNKYGITLNEMAVTVFQLQKAHVDHLTIMDCIISLKAVLSKREVLHIVLLSINLDNLSEKGLLDPTMQYILKHDEALFGVDEDLAISLVQLFGSIAVTNYGYLDVHKSGLAAILDKKPYRVFLDDIVSALIASAASRIAHNDDTNYDTRVVYD